MPQVPLMRDTLIYLLQTVATKQVVDDRGLYSHHEMDFDLLADLLMPLIKAVERNSLAYLSGDMDWRGATKLMDHALS